MKSSSMMHSVRNNPFTDISQSAPPAVAITEEPVPTNPAFLVPVDADVPPEIPQFDIPVDPTITSVPGLKNGVLPSAGSDIASTSSTTQSTSSATPTTIMVDQDARPEPRGGMSPLAERLLIGAGVIGEC